MPSTSTLMTADSVSKRSVMFIDSSRTQGMSTVAGWSPCGQLRATQISDAAGTSASG
jgi:hypothetical protein